MSGHSKWAQIKHKKGIADQKRGQVFSKLARQITVAAKEKGPDPNMNPLLRATIEKAQYQNMPKENIERAIERATGVGAEGLTEMMFEAYGPGGAAILIKVITDNKNRTLQELRHILGEHDGKPATEGSVQWLFDLYGAITLGPNNLSKEDLELAAIEAGVQDIKEQNAGGEIKIIVLTKPQELDAVKRKLGEQKIPVESAELDFIPKTPLPKPEPAVSAKLEKLFEALDEQEDVQEIYSNINL